MTASFAGSDATADRIPQALQLRLDADARIDWDQWSVDGLPVRTSHAAAGSRTKRGATPTKRPTMPSAAPAAASEPSSTS